MKILMSAYACDPYAGSEPGIGFGAMKAAASRHELWLLTRANNLSVLGEWLHHSGLEETVHLVGVDVPGPALANKGSGLISFHRYYDLWQQAAGVKGRELHEAVGFDMVHHATLGAYWTRTGVSSVPAPLVWGPVGGAVRSPFGLLPTLGAEGLLEETARTLGRRLASAWHGAHRVASRAAVTLAVNDSTARLLDSPGRDVSLLPSATAAQVAAPNIRTSRTKDVLMVGRLVAWKGGALAVRALRYLEDPNASLVIVGNGPDEERIRRLTRRWQVSDRVVFKGRMPRNEAIRLVAQCGVLVHPSLHEESGLAVVEALGLGTPVVCLNWGGPANLTPLWPSTPSTMVRPTTPDQTARRLAAAIDDHLAHPPEMSMDWRSGSIDFAAEILLAYERAVAEY